jgi:membrane dipeptidase
LVKKTELSRHNLQLCDRLFGAGTLDTGTWCGFRNGGSLVTSPRLIQIFDGHNDVLLRLYRRTSADAVTAFLDGEDKGQLDLPKARRGGFAGGLFAIFVPSPERKNAGNGETPARDVTSDPAPPAVDVAQAQRAVFTMASLLYRIETASQGRLRVCRTTDDIEACLAGDALAAVLHIEGAEAIDADFEVLDVLYAAGLRSLGPVWSRPNAFGHGVPFRCPSSPDTGPGLTDLGKALIGACNRLRILIDLSHLNERGFWDVAAISDAPLVATHSNAHAISPHSRNLTDEQLTAIRDTGGLVGVNFATSFLRADGRRDKDTPIDLIIEHAAHMLDRLGEDGVAFGSDFDGAQVPAELGDAGGLQKLVDAMRGRSFGEPLIEKLCFRNWLRVLARTWGAGHLPMERVKSPAAGSRVKRAALTPKRL